MSVYVYLRVLWQVKNTRKKQQSKFFMFRWEEQIYHCPCHTNEHTLEYLVADSSFTGYSFRKLQTQPRLVCGDRQMQACRTQQICCKVKQGMPWSACSAREGNTRSAGWVKCCPSPTPEVCFQRLLGSEYWGASAARESTAWSVSGQAEHLPGTWRWLCTWERNVCRGAATRPH